jgi:hypothetical protein
MGKDEEAIVWLRRSIEINRNYSVAHLFLAAARASRPDGGSSRRRRGGSGVRSGLHHRAAPRQSVQLPPGVSKADRALLRRIAHGRCAGGVIRNRRTAIFASSAEEGATGRSSTIRFTSTPGRLLCAITGHPQTAWRTGEFDPKRRFAVGPIDERCAIHCGRAQHATVASIPGNDDSHALDRAVGTFLLHDLALIEAVMRAACLFHANA